MTTSKTKDFGANHEVNWAAIADCYKVRPDTTYLNHGSFGIAPDSVRAERRDWIDRLDAQPMDFYVRQYEPAFHAARSRLADFLNTAASNLVFVENATFGMNVVADSFSLCAGDEVLLNNHEYGAVQRIWRRKCERTGATQVIARLPARFESHEQIVDALFSQVSDRTRIIVVSHITSPTALIMPALEICRQAKQLGIAVCLDGPHAPVQIPLDLDSLCCDFYTASCHKWLAATLGTGFLYVNPKHQSILEPQLKSWGRLLPDIPQKWDEEFIWSGTRDPSAYLSIPAAIDFLDEIGFKNARDRMFHLREYAEQRLIEKCKTRTIGQPSGDWYGTMTHVPLPGGDHSGLQEKLWNQFKIEVPIIEFENNWYVRVSCYLYNNTKQVDYLIDSLGELGI